MGLSLLVKTFTLHLDNSDTVTIKIMVNAALKIGYDGVF